MHRISTGFICKFIEHIYILTCFTIKVKHRKIHQCKSCLKSQEEIFLEEKSFPLLGWCLYTPPAPPRKKPFQSSQLFTTFQIQIQKLNNKQKILTKLYTVAGKTENLLEAKKKNKDRRKGKGRHFIWGRKNLFNFWPRQLFYTGRFE